MGSWAVSRAGGWIRGLFSKRRKKRETAATVENDSSAPVEEKTVLVSNGVYDLKEMMKREKKSNAKMARRERVSIEVSAAILIQSVFRAYLAKKALRALKALVKLQALARGYLVRKQTAETLKCMHSLLKAQTRAIRLRSPSYNASHLSPEIPFIRSLSSPHTRSEEVTSSRRRDMNMTPMYMAETESSRARARSRSAEKRRRGNEGGDKVQRDRRMGSIGSPYCYAGLNDVGYGGRRDLEVIVRLY